MLSRQLIRSGQSCTAARWFSRSNITRKSNQAPKSSEDRNQRDLGHMHRVTNFDRWLLAWVKRYPSAAEVPEEISLDCLLNSRSKARIKGSNYIIFIGVIGCIGAVLFGKKDAEKGETLFKMRQDWYEGIMREKDEEDKNKEKKDK